MGFLIAALGGAVLGWLACAVVIHRPRHPAEPADDLPEPLEMEVLRRSSTGYLVLDAAGRPLLSNERATELGVLRGGMVDRRIAEAAGRVSVSGEPVDVEIRPVPVAALLAASLVTPPPPPSAVLAVVRAIDHGRVLVAAADESAAQRVEDVRRDFFANVSHELKTPVSAMGLLAEASVDAADDPVAVRRFAGKLQSEAVRLGSLVNELIALSRLQGADPLLDMAVVEIDAVIDETVARVSTAAENNGIAITTDRPSGLLVRGDRSLLITALTNLVDNAINYSPSRTVVSISRVLRADHVQIAVTDRGIGIAPEYQERVFERFFRVDPARSRATGGTGLGLAIVKHVAANHGGTAALWSHPGTGSTFTLRLPAFDAPPSRPTPDPHAPGRPARSATAVVPLTVQTAGRTADQSAVGTTTEPAHRGAP
ncbi:MAG TPA: ATP-binding protein [Nakamurella sp.]|nr:ATP-binding protein [Nakamurella sp.]